MRIIRSTFLLTLTLLFTLMLASAEDKWGVKVYDGAKYDADTSALSRRWADRRPATAPQAN
jgi:hypothetical protein